VLGRVAVLGRVGGATGTEGWMKLNLGCGQNKRDGFVNIDKYPTFAPDLLWDLEQTPYPFEAGSVTEITMMVRKV
jgi:hypothetical protein